MTKAKAFFMSRPSTTAKDRRTWLIRIEGDPAARLVRTYPGSIDGPKFVCDCKASECLHVKAAAAADLNRFK